MIIVMAQAHSEGGVHGTRNCSSTRPSVHFERRHPWDRGRGFPSIRDANTHVAPLSISDAAEVGRAKRDHHSARGEMNGFV